MNTIARDASRIAARIRRWQSEIETCIEELDQVLKGQIEAYLEARKRIYKSHYPTKGWEIGPYTIDPTVTEDGVTYHKYWGGEDDDFVLPWSFIEDPEKWEREAAERHAAQQRAEQEQKIAKERAKDEETLRRLAKQYPDVAVMALQPYLLEKLEQAGKDYQAEQS